MMYDAEARSCVLISSQCGEMPTDDPRIRPCAESEDAVCCDFETYMQDCVPQ
ncbi:MAG: hypothetical protein KC656_18495 [Myxococcales bacterium]|nr:hypothetical protein [Myxococcales bacterium]